MDDGTVCYAALGGRVAVLQWAVEQKLQVDLRVCAVIASKAGHGHVLDWLGDLVHGRSSVGAYPARRVPVDPRPMLMHV